MKNKGFIVFLTILISLLCIYYLSFTYISQNIQKQATEATSLSDGSVNVSEKQRYLDSIWNEPVYDLFGIEYTYKEIKETELNLGLDLQGGMHVTLEVSPIDIIKGLSGNSGDADFLAALAQAKENVKGTQLNFVDEFYSEFKEIAPQKELAQIFATAANRGRISLQSTDAEILDIINTEVESAIDRSFNILRTRIDRFGTSQPNIQRLQGTGRIQIELPGVDNPQRVRKLLQGVAKLEFWEVYQQQEIAPVLVSINSLISAEMKKNPGSLTEEEQQNKDDITALLGGDTEGDSLATSEEDSLRKQQLDSLINPKSSPLFELLVNAPQYGGLIYNAKDTAKINRILERDDVQALIPATMKFLWDVQPKDKGEELTGPDLLELYPIRTNRNGRATLTGETISSATASLNERAEPEVTMQMNATGSRTWAKMTRENVGQRIAIVLDNYVFSAPWVRGEIPNGSSSISGGFQTIEEAKDLANILKAGSLPAPTTIVEDVVVGPTLGKVAQSQGLNSIMLGLVIVIVFMVAYYAKGGLIANLALFFNVFFIMGILAQFGTSLTLPGIAGIVLTIGMAIDANVLIFERIKEELRNGAGLKAAISSGYSKAYWSIFDANVTTLIVGIILFTLGQGPVKGFAITLMIGIVCSFFSAVFITRVIVEAFSKKGDNAKISFANAFSKNALTNLNIDFLSKRKLAYTFSSIFIAIGIVALVVKGITLGVDFKGGRSYVITFDEAQTPTEIKTSLSNYFENAGTEVKTFGADNVLKITTSYKIDDETDEADAEVRDVLINGLSETTGLTYIVDGSQLSDGNFTISSSSKVSATIADDIKNSSYQSAIIALICIFIYIVFRFRKWQFGLGAIVALFHDTLFVLSAFAIANMFGISFEADQVFVAAILTIIGYSINDTVVVFDRIRENMGIKSGSELIPVFNESLNNTVSRTLITSLTTLIVVIVLFLFGGAVLQGFSFALLVGIIVGTYSSIFIATPIVIDLNKKTK
ncbi:MAG: protein translocase subunit SecDF [Ekhidna sp.]|uniref:protein translocase subunit SecDF n=1 Tax=Ekhidna sp. TaxID=2608089 RepID=UPI0032ECB1A5